MRQRAETGRLPCGVLGRDLAGELGADVALRQFGELTVQVAEAGDRVGLLGEREIAHHRFVVHCAVRPPAGVGELKGVGGGPGRHRAALDRSDEGGETEVERRGTGASPRGPAAQLRRLRRDAGGDRAGRGGEVGRVERGRRNGGVPEGVERTREPFVRGDKGERGAADRAVGAEQIARFRDDPAQARTEAHQSIGRVGRVHDRAAECLGHAEQLPDMRDIGRHPRPAGNCAGRRLIGCETCEQVLQVTQPRQLGIEVGRAGRIEAAAHRLATKDRQRPEALFRRRPIGIERVERQRPHHFVPERHDEHRCRRLVLRDERQGGARVFDGARRLGREGEAEVEPPRGAERLRKPRGRAESRPVAAEIEVELPAQRRAPGLDGRRRLAERGGGGEQLGDPGVRPLGPSDRRQRRLGRIGGAQQVEPPRRLTQRLERGFVVVRALRPIQPQGAASGAVAHHPADRGVERQAVRMPPVKRRDEPVEPVAAGFKLGGAALPLRLRRGLGSGPGGVQLAQHVLLRRLVAVQFQTEWSKPMRDEAPVHHLQRGALLRHEQDLAAESEVVGDHVGDGLRLARTRRSVEHEVAAACRPDHCGKL